MAPTTTAKLTTCSVCGTNHLAPMSNDLAFGKTTGWVWCDTCAKAYAVADVTAFAYDFEAWGWNGFYAPKA